jgi:hypothetical protein
MSGGFARSRRFCPFVVCFDFEPQLRLSSDPGEARLNGPLVAQMTAKKPSRFFTRLHVESGGSVCPEPPL